MSMMKTAAIRAQTDGSYNESSNGRFVAQLYAALEKYREAVGKKKVSKELRESARTALMHFGGDPWHANISLKDYDPERYGPFLGVSDEGDAAGAICSAALASPKVQAHGGIMPLVVGVAVDAERLGGIGETAVGPDEYADIWLATVGRVLVTTNVGTRVNMRVYGSAPRVILQGTRRTAIERAKREIAAAFAPFVNTPDGRPRPLTVFVELPSYLRATTPARRKLLHELAAFVLSGQAASGKGAPLGHAPDGQTLGLAVRVGWGKHGQAAAMAAIDLAAHAHIATVMIDGVKRKQADQAISYAGLLDYFPPGLIGPLLRRAKEKTIRLRTANLPDTDTIARSVWVGLNTARSFGANLGKYGCFPLTLDETDSVVDQIQRWMASWSAAPVLFVDQGVLTNDEVDVGHDLMRGLRRWLQTVAARGAKVVLIDTVDKAKGGHLLRQDSADKKGFLSLAQIKRLDKEAKQLGVKVLWAGGLAARDAYQMGRLGVFGIYVTSAVARLVPVNGSYVRDPALAALKEPQQDAVLRVKILIEAGFLSSRLSGEEANGLMSAAEQLLTILDEKGEAGHIVECTNALAALCRKAWQAYWSSLPSERAGLP